MSRWDTIVNLRYWIGGALFGWFFDDLLKALGLHWLAWPVTGALAVFALAGTIIVSRRQSRR